MTTTQAMDEYYKREGKKNIQVEVILELKFDWQKQKKMLKTFLILILLINNIYAGPAAGAICSAGCAAVVVACYGAAGVVFGK